MLAFFKWIQGLEGMTYVIRVLKTTPARILNRPVQMGGILFFLGLASCIQLEKRPMVDGEFRRPPLETPVSTGPKYEGLVGSGSDGLNQSGDLSTTAREEINPPPRVGLILGPGGVKTWAQTGVIRELVKRRIPIDYIVGIEWGALVGGLFARKGEIHDVEWKLYKLKKKDIISDGLFTKSSASYPIKNLINYFNKDLENLAMGSLHVPMSCPSLSMQSGVTSWQRRGKLTSALSKCMAFPPLFKPYRHWVSAVFSLKESIKYLRARGMDLIVFVNVMDGGELLEASYSKSHPGSVVLWQELRRYLNRSLVGEPNFELINVSTKNIKIYDFKSHRLLVAAGGRAGRRAAQRLIQKYGF